MANNCNYSCRIASRNREAVQQFINALQYKDLKNGYYMCRIFTAYPTEFHVGDGNEVEVIKDDDGIYYAEVSGDCAWSVGGCMIDADYGIWRGIHYMEPKFEVWRDYEGEICYSNIGVTAPMLCKLLGCGFEIWGDECGCEFQEHYIVNAEGEIVTRETVHWEQGYDTDENGEFLDYNPDKDVGGFEGYGSFQDAYDLINAE